MCMCVCVYVCTCVQEFAVDGLVNLVGGCCGSTPEHIRCVEGGEGGGGEGWGGEREGGKGGEEGAFVQCFSQLPVVVRCLLT